MKFLVLNVKICTHCPHQRLRCPGHAAAGHGRTIKKVTGYKLVCERGHETAWPQGAITNGKTCLSVYRRLLSKESRGKDIPSIEEYLKQEAEKSLLAARPDPRRRRQGRQGTPRHRRDPCRHDLPFRGRELHHHAMPGTGISQVRLEDHAIARRTRYHEQKLS